MAKNRRPRKRAVVGFFKDNEKKTRLLDVKMKLFHVGQVLPYLALLVRASIDILVLRFSLPTQPVTKPLAEFKRKRKIRNPKTFRPVRPKNKVIKLGDHELIFLKKFASKIQVAGTIRRQVVDIVIVPRNEVAKQKIIDYALEQPQGNIGRGEKLIAYKKKGVEVDIYFSEKIVFTAPSTFYFGKPHVKALRNFFEKIIYASS